MKKVIAILAVLVVLVGAVFATTGDKIELQSTVGRIKPGFAILSGAATGTTTGAELDTDADLSESDITMSFSLKQSGNEQSKSYSRYKGAITLTVTINPFTSSLGSQVTAYEITTATKGTEVANKLTLGNPAIAENKHSVTFGLTYAGKKVADTDAAALGTLTAKWTQDPDLPMDGESTVYTSDVVLTYTVN